MRSLSTMAAMIIEHLLCMQTIQQFSAQNTLYTNYSSYKSTIIRLRFLTKTPNIESNINNITPMSPMPIAIISSDFILLLWQPYTLQH